MIGMTTGAITSQSRCRDRRGEHCSNRACRRLIPPSGLVARRRKRVVSRFRRCACRSCRRRRSPDRRGKQGPAGRRRTKRRSRSPSGSAPAAGDWRPAPGSRSRPLGMIGARLACDPPAGEDQQIDRVSEHGDAEQHADDVLRQDQIDADGEKQPDEQRKRGFHQASSRSSSASAIEAIEPTTTK